MRIKLKNLQNLLKYKGQKPKKKKKTIFVSIVFKKTQAHKTVTVSNYLKIQNYSSI
jgi:hypothetical protein